MSNRAEAFVNDLELWARIEGLVCERSLGGDLAVFSPDRLRRYILTRAIGSLTGRVLAGIGANPSTADAFTNDATIRRGIGFASAWGCELYVMLNAYGWRATDPGDMWREWKRGEDIIGAHNDLAIGLVLDLLGEHDIPLAAWGAIPRPERAHQVAAIATTARVRLQCLGVTKSGAPKHPLYLAANTPLQHWTSP
jgi:hypothetical protein